MPAPPTAPHRPRPPPRRRSVPPRSPRDGDRQRPPSQTEVGSASPRGRGLSRRPAPRPRRSRPRSAAHDHAAARDVDHHRNVGSNLNRIPRSWDPAQQENGRPVSRSDVAVLWRNCPASSKAIRRTRRNRHRTRPQPPARVAPARSPNLIVAEAIRPGPRRTRPHEGGARRMRPQRAKTPPRPRSPPHPRVRRRSTNPLRPPNPPPPTRALAWRWSASAPAMLSSPPRPARPKGQGPVATLRGSRRARQPVLRDRLDLVAARRLPGSVARPPPLVRRMNALRRDNHRAPQCNHGRPTWGARHARSRNYSEYDEKPRAAAMSAFDPKLTLGCVQIGPPMPPRGPFTLGLDRPMF